MEPEYRAPQWKGGIPTLREVPIPRGVAENDDRMGASPKAKREAIMKIKKLETFVKGQIGMVRVTTDDGKEGWG